MDPGWEFAAPRKRETRGYDNRDRRNSRDGPERIVVRDDSGEETWEAVVTTRRTDGSIAEQNVINRDGSYIRSEFASGSGDLSFGSQP